MPREQPSLPEMFEREKARQLKVLGDAFAARLGRPPGAKRMSDARLIEKYLERDPAVTPKMVEQAKMQGATPDDVTRMLHPYREATYTVGVVGPDEQIKEANRIARLAEKHQAAQQPVDGSLFLSGSLGPSPMPQQAPTPAQSMPSMPPEQPPAEPEQPQAQGAAY